MAVVAARQLSLSASRRRACVRRSERLFAAIRPLLALMFAVLAAGAIELATTAPASAQYTPRPPHPTPPRVPTDNQMLVQAVEALFFAAGGHHAGRVMGMRCIPD